MSIRQRLLRGSLLARTLGGLGRALYALGLHRVLIRRHAAIPKILLYHGCEEEESDFTRGLGTNIRPAELAGQLDFLARHYRIVPLTAITEGEAPTGAVALTFDDGYRSVYTGAFPQLARRGLPATLFLVTGAIGNAGAIWVNELNWMLRRHPGVARPLAAGIFGVPEAAAVEDILDHLYRGYDAGRMEALLGRIRDALGLRAGDLAREARLYVDRGELEEMARHGFSFGSHTVSHPNLVRLAEPERREELRRSREAVSRLPAGRDSLSYPFGEVDPAVRRAAGEAGYREMLEIGGVNRSLENRPLENRPVDPCRLARVVVRSTTPAGLFAEMEVVNPFKAFLRRLFPGL